MFKYGRVSEDVGSPLRTPAKRYDAGSGGGAGHSNCRACSSTCKWVRNGKDSSLQINPQDSISLYNPFGEVIDQDSPI